ncbi:MAG TPA: hypothetical protein EYQ84_01815 [Nitrospinaceae bacterium]|nr:hypothetical protein [Nitrospinaceae bacterium]
MSYIKNVKISTIFQSALPINHFEEIAITRKIQLRYARNILSIKDQFPFTIFRKKNNIYHINITGISSIHQIANAVNWIESNYCPSTKFTLLFQSIDNITSTFNIGHKLCLNQIAENIKSAKFNPERFPGLYLKTNSALAVIFNSGFINILGCKSEKEVLLAWQNIQSKLSAVKMKSIY